MPNEELIMHSIWSWRDEKFRRISCKNYLEKLNRTPTKTFDVQTNTRILKSTCHVWRFLPFSLLPNNKHRLLTRSLVDRTLVNCCLLRISNWNFACRRCHYKKSKIRGFSLSKVYQNRHRLSTVISHCLV